MPDAGYFPPPMLFFRSSQILAATFSNWPPLAFLRGSYVDHSTSRDFTATRNTVPLPPPNVDMGGANLLTVSPSIGRTAAGGWSSSFFGSGFGGGGGGYNSV